MLSSAAEQVTTAGEMAAMAHLSAQPSDQAFSTLRILTAPNVNWMFEPDSLNQRKVLPVF
jgi:hypothetical protein